MTVAIIKSNRKTCKTKKSTSLVELYFFFSLRKNFFRVKVRKNLREQPQTHADYAVGKNKWTYIHSTNHAS